MKYRCVTFAINEQGGGEVGESDPTLHFFRLRRFSMLECSTNSNVKKNKFSTFKKLLRRNLNDENFVLFLLRWAHNIINNMKRKIF